MAQKDAYVSGRERLWAAQETVERADYRDRSWLIHHFQIAGWLNLFFKQWARPTRQSAPSEPSS